MYHLFLVMAKETLLLRIANILHHKLGIPTMVS
jgi:hypothetical protein